MYKQSAHGWAWRPSEGRELNGALRDRMRLAGVFAAKAFARRAARPITSCSSMVDRAAGTAANRAARHSHRPIRPSPMRSTPAISPSTAKPCRAQGRRLSARRRHRPPGGARWPAFPGCDICAPPTRRRRRPMRGARRRFSRAEEVSARRSGDGAGRRGAAHAVVLFAVAVAARRRRRGFLRRLHAVARRRARAFCGARSPRGGPRAPIVLFCAIALAEFARLRRHRAARSRRRCRARSPWSWTGRSSPTAVMSAAIRRCAVDLLLDLLPLRQVLAARGLQTPSARCCARSTA